MQTPQDSLSDEQFTAFVEQRDALCPRCGYNLRGLQAAVCPECGDRLQLTVALVEPRLGAYVTMLLATGMGLGGSSLFGVIALTEAPSGWWDELASYFLRGLFAFAAIGLIATLLLRRRLRRMSSRRQWFFAGLAGAVVAAMGIAIIATFR